eukprot:403334509
MQFPKHLHDVKDDVRQIVNNHFNQQVNIFGVIPQDFQQNGQNLNLNIPAQNSTGKQHQLNLIGNGSSNNNQNFQQNRQSNASQNFNQSLTSRKAQGQALNTQNKSNSIQDLNNVHRNLVETVITRSNKKRNSSQIDYLLSQQSQRANLVYGQQQIISQRQSMKQIGNMADVSCMRNVQMNKSQIFTQNSSSIPLITRDQSPINGLNESQQNMVQNAYSRNRKHVMQNLSDMIEQQQQHEQSNASQQKQQQNFPNVNQQANYPANQSSPKSQVSFINSQISPQTRSQLKNPFSKQSQIKEIALMRDERFPLYQNYKDQQQTVENKYKEFFVLNKNIQEKFQLSNQLAVAKGGGYNQKRRASNDGLSQQSSSILQSQNFMNNSNSQQQQMSQQFVIGGQHEKSSFKNNKIANTSRQISTSQVKNRGQKMFNQTQFMGNRTGKSMDRKNIKQFQNQEEQISYRNLGFYENLINARSSISKRNQELSKEFESNQEVLDIIQDQGHFFYFQKETQIALEKQLIRLRKFSIDFQITQKTIGDSIADFFMISDKNLNKQVYLQQQQDSSFGSQDSYRVKKLKQSLLDERQVQFDQLKKKIDGLTYPLQSYTKDIMRGTLSLKQEEQLKKRSGLMDFISEMNDCQKNILRLMHEVSHKNCFPMYAIDFLWKLMLVRIEYHLDDEEQRLQKVQKYYDSQLKKEIAEIQYSIQSKEEHYKDVIHKLEKQKEMMEARIDKLMNDKGELLDAMRDKEDELQLLRNPAGVKQFGNLNSELEAYIDTIKDRKQEQTVAIKGLKVFMDTLTSQKQYSLMSDSMISPQNQSPKLTKEFSIQTAQVKNINNSSSSNEDDQTSLLKVQRLISQEMHKHSNNSDLQDVISQNTSSKFNVQSAKKQLQILEEQRQDQLEIHLEKQELKLQEIPLVKMNKSLGVPNYKAIDEGYMASQLSQIQNSAFKSASKQKGQLYSMISQNQDQNKIKRTRDQQIQTDVDEDFICSNCLLRANNEEYEYHQKQLQQQKLTQQHLTNHLQNDNEIKLNFKQGENDSESQKNYDSQQSKQGRKVSKNNGKSVGFTDDIVQNDSRSRQSNINQQRSSQTNSQLGLGHRKNSKQESQVNVDREESDSNIDSLINQDTNKSRQTSISKRNTNQKEETLKLTKLIEKQNQMKSRTKSMLKANSFLTQNISSSNGVGTMGNMNMMMQKRQTLSGAMMGNASVSMSTNLSRLHSNQNNLMFNSPGLSSRLTLADQLNHESKEIIIMPEQTLIKQVEELLEKKFDNDERLLATIKLYQMQSQQSNISGIHGQNQQPAISSQALVAYQNSNSQQDLLIFAFTHFLNQQGLKSLAIRYLNSLYSGLRKIYLKDTQEYQYAQFLMQIFGFNPTEFPAFRPDQTRIALKVRHLFQLVQKYQQQQQTQKAQNLSASIISNKTRLTNGGQIQFLEFIPYLFKACRNQPKGVFANIINRIQLQELSYNNSLSSQQVQRHFVSMKILLMLAYSRLELSNLALKTDERELQMDVVIMHLEETLEIKVNKNEINAFKKEFTNFFLVPLKDVEYKIIKYTQTPATVISSQTPDFQISLLVLMNLILEEWELYQSSQKKKLLKKFIDFDENGDGVLTLDEFKELMKSLEGSSGMNSNERIVMLFKEAVELSNELEQMNLHQNSDNNNEHGDLGGQGNGKITGSDKISPECFVETVVRHRLGGYGNEFLDFEYLNQQLLIQQQQNLEKQ